MYLLKRQIALVKFHESRTLTFQKVTFICFNESPLEMMKFAFYFVLKVFFVLKIFKFCPDFCDYVGKRVHEKADVNFKNCDVTNWTTNNYDTDIAQYFFI